MGTIRMVMLDGLAVADLLALRQGGFFEGAEVRLPSTDGRAGIQLPPPPTEVDVAAAAALPVERRPGGWAGDSLNPGAALIAEQGMPAIVRGGGFTLSGSPPVKLTAEQEATLAQARAELAEFRAEKAPAVAQDVRSEPMPTTDPSPPSVAPVSASSGLPSVAQLSACTKLRDVLQLLLEGGMASADLTGYLEGVRDQVPLLGRISNIGERVTRTLSVMGQGG